MESKCTMMMFAGCALGRISGTYKFYNPNTDAINIRNSVRWRHFKSWEAENVEEEIEKLNTATL